MKEKPILFSKPMVKALLNTKPGTWPAEPLNQSLPFKWQTRRIIKPQPSPDAEHYSKQPDGKRYCFWPNEANLFKCPYQAGDVLWVRETWGIGTRPDPNEGWVDGIEYRADCDGLREHDLPPLYPIPAGVDVTEIRQGRWIPGIHMFRWACRITLEVMEVRAERLQAITEEDAKAEGATPWQHDPQQRMTTGELGVEQPYRGGFACLWDGINEDHTWLRNPWAWAYSFKRLT